MRNVGLIAAAAIVAAIAVASETEPAKVLNVDAASDGDAFEPPPEITEDPVTEVQETEPEKPKRGRKKAEVSDESDSDG